MAYIVKLGNPRSTRPARGAAKKVTEAWQSPATRTRISILLAITLLATVGFGLQVAPSIRAALFPIASRDLPADADPSPILTLQEAGVFDRTIPGSVKLPGTDGKTAMIAEDPTERPFVRGASPVGR